MSEPVFQLPAYWHPRPEAALDAATRAAFDDLLTEATARGPAEPLSYRLTAPKWHFLCYVAEERGLALHGSPRPDIERFEPHQPHDLHAFGAQNAVYAAGDGIWPIYFAILDRERTPTTLINDCIRVIAPDGSVSAPYYLFSIGRHVIGQRPYTPGTIYLLPRASFAAEPPGSFSG